MYLIACCALSVCADEKNPQDFKYIAAVTTAHLLCHMLIETVCLQTNAVIASEFMKMKFGVALHGV